MAELKRKVRVALDAMGGDYAPAEIVKGAISAARELDIEIILTGPLDILNAELAKHSVNNLPIYCVGADKFIQEGDKTIIARRQSDTSISVAAMQVKEGKADALVSAGPTGALVASAIQHLGTIDGIKRPVIGGALTTFAPKTVLMDCGVNVDCKPYHLLTFAIVGEIYARKLLKIESPTIALLNIGSEESKGNELTREAYQLLKGSGLNFIGNIEGNGILKGEANVIVCDGFVGNVLFKFCEGGFDVIHDWLGRKLRHRPLASLLKSLTNDLTSLTSMPESVGSGLIWGIDGITLKMHGASQAHQVADKIAQVKMAVEMDIIGSLKSELAAIKSRLNLERSQHVC